MGMTSFLKTHPLIKIIAGALYDLPTPSNIRTMWNFGSLLGLCLIIQILTGLFLSIHYSRDASLAFTRVSHISRDVNYGWLLCIFHANGARFFYMFIFTCRSRAILWVILFSSYLKCGRYYPSSGYSNCLPRVCFTLRSNILLGCNCYYKFILYNPFYWGRLGPMNMGRICRR